MQFYDVTILQCDSCGYQQIATDKSLFYGLSVVRAGAEVRKMELCEACMECATVAIQKRTNLCSSQSFRMPSAGAK